MCLRREVAQLYSERVRNDRIRLALGRQGTSLGAGEDTDMVWTSFLLNKGTGCFARLRLTHLISKDRLTEPYFERLYTGFAYSYDILLHDYAGGPNDKDVVWNRMRYWFRCMIASPFGRKIMQAQRLGRKTARKTILEMRASSLPRNSRKYAVPGDINQREQHYQPRSGVAIGALASDEATVSFSLLT